ncbi:hypothetical protein OOU_Y34scaffold00777g4 [Pyricularia oryzae Y34]|uniref:Uncharacterized protein n=3 Tax=Pyricularia oryzae TaxID=318829 RepID=Q2KGU6_PYRO7|nr:hypothetical protein MGCH7_ch7g239 [Pyricularia oryzae 70-15]ELQ34246.1 hypothetical protein OOU_Y34scaffold00777g4 [Pyricularia oryzae Y34]
MQLRIRVALLALSGMTSTAAN